MKYLEMKKRAFMSIVNAVKGFVRTISGTPPITLPDCVDNDSLINYSISGNSVQNGEPTPENPIEVENVGDYDEETGKYKIPIKMSGANLIDMETISTSTNFKRSGDIFISNRGIYANWVRVDCNVKALDVGNYVLSADVMQADSTTDPNPSQVGFRIRSNSTSIKTKYSPIVREEWKRVSIEFTLTESIEGFNFSIQPSGGASKFDNLNMQIKNIQLEKSDTMGGYEPYIEPIYTTLYLDEPLALGEILEYPKDNIPKLPTIKGTTIYSIETTVQPTNMSATYYSTMKE